MPKARILHSEKNTFAFSELVQENIDILWGMLRTRFTVRTQFDRMEVFSFALRINHEKNFFRATTAKHEAFEYVIGIR
jgi:hypothetical protein